MLSCFLLVASTASATKTGSQATLDDLIGGDGIILSSGGGLQFSNFAIEITGGNADLSQYRIEGRWNGFKLYGAEPQVDNSTLDIRLTYDVATVPLNHAMTAVALSSHKWHSGSVAMIDVFNNQGDPIGGGARSVYDDSFDREYFNFSEIVHFASVSELISIGESIGKKKWQLSRRFKIDNDVVPIPEPGTALMMGLGMAGFASYSRRRRSS